MEYKQIGDWEGEVMALERRAVRKHKRDMVSKVMQREGGGGGRRRPARALYTTVTNIHRSNASV